jgi:hypothetical protein
MLYMFRKPFISCRVAPGLRGKFSFELQREFVKRAKPDLGMEGFDIRYVAYAVWVTAGHIGGSSSEAALEQVVNTNKMLT